MHASPISIRSAAIILTPGVIKQYFPMFMTPLLSPMFQDVNFIYASGAPIKVG
tara:strand:+ start:4337 stop:4495 length:159 start_codon:yes stop_codon:yes gene_type:complete